MTTKNELLEEMAGRADLLVELERDDDEGRDEDAVGVAVMVTDYRGKALAIEVGTGERGAYATVRAFDGDDQTEPLVFVETTSTMIVVE